MFVVLSSVNSTSPGILFGGTWERIQDKFLLCAGNSYAAGSTGGEATHTLTVAEMPSHRHGLIVQGQSGSTHAQYRFWVGFNGSNNTWDSSLDWTTQATVQGLIGNTGDGQAHNNMPPYLAVYVWKRTA